MSGERDKTDKKEEKGKKEHVEWGTGDKKLVVTILHEELHKEDFKRKKRFF